MTTHHTRRRSRPHLVLAATLLAGATFIAACSPADDPQPDLAELDLEPVATVVVDETGFEPDRLQLTAGEGIELVNEGDQPHSFVATSPARDTGELLPGEVVLLRFDAADEIEAHDGTDPEHTITIEVVERAEG